jgi:hypothetical protein
LDLKQSFSEVDQGSVRAAIEELNQGVGRTLIALDSKEASSPISIELVESISPRQESPLSSGTRVAGRATQLDSGCEILISKFVLESPSRDLLRSVLWHELGHCAGLEHVHEEGEIMYRSSVSFRNYSKSSLEKFFADLISAIEAQ